MNSLAPEEPAWGWVWGCCLQVRVHAIPWSHRGWPNTSIHRVILDPGFKRESQTLESIKTEMSGELVVAWKHRGQARVWSCREWYGSRQAWSSQLWYLVWHWSGHRNFLCIADQSQSVAKEPVGFYTDSFSIGVHDKVQCLTSFSQEQCVFSYWLLNVEARWHWWHKTGVFSHFLVTIFLSMSSCSNWHSAVESVLWNHILPSGTHDKASSY